MEKLRLPKEMEAYKLALDKYLFSLYTGLRFSDISELKPQSLVLEEGKEWLVLNTKKTSEPVRIPIHLLFEGRALDIFYNYVGSGVTVFPFQYNHLLNADLKKVIEHAGIKKKITFHTARHTTATFLLYKGVNITTVQKLLGHRRIETTQIYGKVMDMTLLNDLKNVSYSR
ncbi:site-specific integrase [uncultured Sunxiuqinia sp.]|uniref:site-specific integrase n=1 Tax=uncultured Sunxiuqinia sp. TaxID=1573825 RepID=UPI002AA88873|nr:site-specific integrase [uncultured Sunxiuqinia sp.]